MIKRLDVNIISNPICSKPIHEYDPLEFRYYDKDGFELNQAEQKYYREMGYPVDNSILNHYSWQEPWFELTGNPGNLILDHSMVLTRCSYGGAAFEQIRSISQSIPEAKWLIDTDQKWGFDFALDAISPDEKLFEVIHIEYDSKDFDHFSNRMIAIEQTIRHIDWEDAARQVWEHRDQWQPLKAFSQNDWKAEFLLGWKKAEYTEKSLT